MATYTSLIYHIVFSTKDRHPLITPQIRQPLYQYIGGILRHEGATLLEVGGIEDHVHILTSLKSTMAVSDAARLVKSNSSRWLNEVMTFGCFRWQSGYGAFTVARSSISPLRKYIQNQQHHHCTQTFKDEFRGLLESHGVEFDEKYIWR